MKLNKLAEINIARYTSTFVDRILNRRDTLASKITAMTNKFPSFATYKENTPNICKRISATYMGKKINILDTQSRVNKEIGPFNLEEFSSKKPITSEQQYMKINSPAINMINTQKWKGKMVAWTDGSKSSTKAVASVWINENNESNVSFDVPTHWEIDQIEATAIEAALHITPENEDL